MKYGKACSRAVHYSMKIENRLSVDGLLHLRKKCPYSELLWYVFSRIFSHSMSLRDER